MYMRFIHDFATAQNDNNIIFDHWTRPGWHGCLQRHACARTWVGHGVLFVGLAIHVCLHTPCVPLSLLRSWARCSDYTEHLVWPTQTHSHIHANMCGIWWTHWNIPFFFMANNFWLIIFGAKYRRDPWYVKCDADVEAYFHRLHLQTDTNTSLDVCMWCEGILHISVLSDLNSIGHCEDAEMRKKNQTKRTGLRTNMCTMTSMLYQSVMDWLHTQCLFPIQLEQHALSLYLSPFISVSISLFPSYHHTLLIHLHLADDADSPFIWICMHQMMALSTGIRG